jgi:hypothetical protein
VKKGFEKVTTQIKVENWLDAELLAAGTRKEKPRSIETEALVDTGAVKFYLKSSIIRQLGLRPIGEIKSRTMSNRSEPRTVFSLVSLEIQGRPSSTSSSFWAIFAACHRIGWRHSIADRKIESVNPENRNWVQVRSAGKASRLSPSSRISLTD